MSKLQIKADKKDLLRPLLTDTAPYETPLMFSNDGLYENLKNHKNTENIFHSEIMSTLFAKSDIYTKPYAYKINKGSGSLRNMSLIHPSNQLKYAEFYNQFDGMITHYCKNSVSSIRSPIKVGNMYYVDGFSDALSKYRLDKVDTLKDDLLSRFSTSYFAYNGYNRLHKFINSYEYLRLEKKYPFLITMDVSRCFETIYTHSISWATKNKEFSKLNANKYSFGNNFDVLMQRSNYNETNGIPIGAEISRIFSEIILESIDQSAIDKLSEYGYVYNRDYFVRRYVDDYYIYTKDKETQEIVSGNFIDRLSDYNLSINQSKTTVDERPFFSKRSSAMLKLADEIDSFHDSITKVSYDSEGNKLVFPVNIRRKNSVISNFTKRVKGICADYEQTYESVSTYVIVSVFNRIVKIIESYEHRKDSVADYDYRALFETLLETSFFFYSVSPVVSASYTIGKIVIISNRFFDEELSDESPTIKQIIYDGCTRLIKSNVYQAPNYIDNHITLEKINIFIALEEIGNEYALPAEFLKDNLINGKNLGYFEIISLLFYIKNNQEYDAIKKTIYDRLKIIFRDFTGIETESGVAHLFLDIASCPYINDSFRKKILKKYRNIVGLPKLTEVDEDSQCEYFFNNCWFVNWNNIDLYNTIEKKELKMAY